MHRPLLVAALCLGAACGGRGAIGLARDGAAGSSGAAGAEGAAGFAGAGEGTAGAAGRADGGLADGGPPAHGDPGWTGLRRLTDVEYANTMRDLLGVTVGTKSLTDDLPLEADPTSALSPRLTGFDNEAAKLRLSAARYEWSFAAAVTALDAAFASDAFRPRYFTCDASTDPLTKDAPCVRHIVGAFGLRAWRRPLTADELDGLAAIVAGARVAGVAVNAALQRAFVATLVSESFFYRVERDPEPATLAVHALSPYELATRLSYLLWSTMPDDALFARASTGELLDETKLRAEVERMLDDPRSAGFVRDFMGQWLGFRALEGPLLERPPLLSWTVTVQRAAAREVTRFVDMFLREDRALTQLLTADVKFVDEYYLPPLYGLSQKGPPNELVRVDGATKAREGILGLVATLALTSPSAETSPTLRGLWIDSRLACLDVPAPPASSPPAPGTPRERAAAIAAQPACGTCHALMDPVGLALEQYDQVGVFRATYPGASAPIDPTGMLPGGATFSGLSGLAEALAGEPRFRRCLARQILTYGLGRRLDAHDEAAIARLDAAVGADGTLRALIAAMVADDVFGSRRGEGP